MLKFFNLKVAFVLGGLALVGVAAYLNVHHAAESEGGNYLAPVCIAIVALAFGSALAVPVMLTLQRNGHRALACAAFAGLVAAESYGFQLSAERLLAARDQRAQQVKSANAPRELAREALLVTHSNPRHRKRCRGFLRLGPCASRVSLCRFQARRSPLSPRSTRVPHAEQRGTCLAGEWLANRSRLRDPRGTETG